MSNRMTLAAALATLTASLSLYPVVAGWHWFWVGFGAVITIAVVGTLTRLRRLPVVVCALAELAALLLFLNIQFASAKSAAGCCRPGPRCTNWARWPAWGCRRPTGSRRPPRLTRPS